MARSTWTFSKNSWHFKLYTFWKKLGEVKNSPLYKENLCHYWRVVMIWAPWRWFIGYEIAGMAYVRPATVLLTAVLFAIAIGLFIVFTWSALAVVGAVLLGAALILGCACGVAWLDGHNDQALAWCNKWVWSWAKYILRPIGKIFSFIGRCIVGAFEWCEENTSSTVWIGLVGTVLAVAFLACLLRWPLATALVVVGGLVIGMLAGFFTVGGIRLHRLWKERGGREVEESDPKGPGMGRVTWEYAKAKKHRICPFIEFGD